MRPLNISPGHIPGVVNIPLLGVMVFAVPDRVFNANLFTEARKPPEIIQTFGSPHSPGVIFQFFTVFIPGLDVFSLKRSRKKNRDMSRHPPEMLVT